MSEEDDKAFAVHMMMTDVSQYVSEEGLLEFLVQLEEYAIDPNLMQVVSYLRRLEREAGDE